jgi:hypothetical protein
MKLAFIHKYSFVLFSVAFAFAYRLLIIKTVLLVIPFLILFGIVYGLSFYASVWSYRKYAGANSIIGKINVEVLGFMIFYCLFPLSWMLGGHNPYLIFSTFGVISTATFITVLFYLKKFNFIPWTAITFIIPVTIYILLTNNDPEDWDPTIAYVIPAWIIFNGIFYQFFFQKLIKDDNSKPQNALTE